MPLGELKYDLFCEYEEEVTMAKYTVKLSKIIKECHLESVYLPCSADEIFIQTSEVNRPGLLLSGFESYFDNTRIQILGRMEHAYLRSQPDSSEKKIKNLFAKTPPAVVITRNQDVLDSVMYYAKEFKVPVLRSEMTTSDFMSTILDMLSNELAPRIIRHGVLIEVYGEGVLITGDSSIGKSETAIELVHRGHRLVADDAVEIKKVSRNRIIGSSPENIRHFIELRGIGMINVSRLFGVGSVKVEEEITMVINLESWDPQKQYERMGLDSTYMEILDVKISSLTIPVQPGRNLSNIIEVAVKNERQKKLGYNAAEELLKQLGME